MTPTRGQVLTKDGRRYRVVGIVEAPDGYDLVRLRSLQTGQVLTGRHSPDALRTAGYIIGKAT